MKLKSNKTYITFYSYLCSVNKLNCIINSKLIMYAGKGNVLQKNLFPICIFINVKNIIVAVQYV